MHIARICERLPRLQIQFGFQVPFDGEIRQILHQKSVFGFAERKTPLIYLTQGLKKNAVCT